MKIRDVVEAFHEAFPVDRSMGHLSELTKLDRYQASRGIEEAADYVAEAAERSGLEGVRVRRYPADGERRWWTFRAPASWTPLEASLEILGGGGGRGHLVTSYPPTPYSVAAYSAPTPKGGIVAPLQELSADACGRGMRGAIAVIPPSSREPLPKAIGRAARAGAGGFVADPLSGAGVRPEPGAVGRLELRPGGALFGFSVDARAMGEVLRAARAGASARAVVGVDRSASMPLVEGHLPGSGEDEVLLQAHLCHARPGANDNASGVAALLGIAETVRALTGGDGSPRRLRGVRFLWGPEFVGTAAYLHGVVEGGGQGRLPLCVLNLDMVGEDQRRCGGPLILERSPDHVPSFVDALAERCVELLPQEGRSYSGAVPTATWAWRATPFVGTSDHALFADRYIGRPAVQIGHWPDRFNHTSADGVDKVDPEELRRSATVAGATALVVSLAGAQDLPEIEQTVAQWGAHNIANVAQAAIGVQDGPPGVMDPFSREEITGLLEHEGHVATTSLEATAGLATRLRNKRTQSLSWIRRQVDEHASLFPLPRRRVPEETSSLVLQRRWQGPFNLQAFTEELPRSQASWISTELARDKGIYGLILTLALAIDDKSSRRSAMRRAAYSSRLTVSLAFADRFFDMLERYGWVEEVPKE
jgi:hypothetical protein